jgi:sugar phosphate isomerase/epimerase
MLNKPQIGMQLYGVREACAKDLPRTLEKLAKMGYKGVEFHDTYGHSAEAICRYLNDAGLLCCGFHFRPFSKLISPELDEIIEFNKTIGNPYLIIPGPLPEEYTCDLESFNKVVELISGISQKTNMSGIRIGYHNENIDLVPANGFTVWNSLVELLPKNIFFQLDTGNAAAGDADVMKCLELCGDRLTTIHIKAFSKKQPNAIIGNDELPWVEILKLISANASTEWFVIEYESNLYEPLIAMEKSLENFNALLPKQ